MNNIFTWIIVAAVALGGTWYLYSGSAGGDAAESPVATTTVPTSTSTPQAAVPPAVKKPAPAAPKPAPAKLSGYSSISYLLSLKEPLVCTVKATSPVSRTGTIYLSGGKMRGDFATASMIDDGTYLYAWKSGASTGLKLLAASSVSGTAIANAGGLDLESSFSFSCNVWVENASLFAPPTSVAF